MTDTPRIRLARTVSARQALVIVGCLEDDASPPNGVGGEVAEALGRAIRRGGWSARRGQRSEAEARDGRNRVVVAQGLGKAGALDGEGLTRWIDRVGTEIRTHGATTACVVLPNHPLFGRESAVRAFLRRLALVDYRFTEFRRPESRAKPIHSLSVLPPADSASTFRRALPEIESLAAGIRLTRDLANTPPNVATPEWMAAQARKLARAHGMRSTVLGPRELARRGMGGILAVGGGSAHPPRLVRLEWGGSGPTVALVGKGVTFDTGGISIKPAASMDEMKYDKSGACTVLGIARATARMDLPLRLRAYLPLAENMPDGAAYRPGDIVTCYNDKTVEIRNTDAEGRMILADALTWAARQSADYIVDYATLTGACVVALGSHGAGLFSHSDELASSLLEAAARADEPLWRLPLWPEFTRAVKGVHADLKNSASRWGSACTAAAFLAEFVEGTEQWAHLDIAGPAYVGNSEAGRKGATGYGVALTVDWLRSVCG